MLLVCGCVRIAQFGLWQWIEQTLVGAQFTHLQGEDCALT